MAIQAEQARIAEAQRQTAEQERQAAIRASEETHRG